MALYGEAKYLRELGPRDESYFLTDDERRDLDVSFRDIYDHLRFPADYLQRPPSPAFRALATLEFTRGGPSAQSLLERMDCDDR